MVTQPGRTMPSRVSSAQNITVYELNTSSPLRTEASIRIGRKAEMLDNLSVCVTAWFIRCSSKSRVQGLITFLQLSLHTVEVAGMTAVLHESTTPGQNRLDEFLPDTYLPS